MDSRGAGQFGNLRCVKIKCVVSYFKFLRFYIFFPLIICCSCYPYLQSAPDVILKIIRLSFREHEFVVEEGGMEILDFMPR